MHALVATPAFGFEDAQFDYGDVVLAAIARGDWQALERDLAHGITAEALARQRGEPPGDSELRAAVVAFRRARRLAAGEDYRRWLDERSLAHADVTAHLSRAIVRKRRDDQVAVTASPVQLAQTVRSEAILSGRLGIWAQRLAASAASARGLRADGLEAPVPSPAAVQTLADAAGGCPACGLDQDGGRARAPRIVALLAAERAFREHVVSDERIERCLGEHRLDWQRLTWQELALRSEGAAREAKLWVRDQGLGLDEVAALARAEVQAREAYGCDVPVLAGMLVAAAPGDLLGPLHDEHGWRLLSLRGRRPPGLDDRALRERAITEIVADALERHLAGRVWRHGKL